MKGLALKIDDYAKLITEHAQMYHDAVTAYDYAVLIGADDELIYGSECNRCDAEQDLLDLISYYHGAWGR